MPHTLRARLAALGLAALLFAACARTNPSGAAGVSSRPPSMPGSVSPSASPGATVVAAPAVATSPVATASPGAASPIEPTSSPAHAAVTLPERRFIGGPRPDIATLIRDYQYGEAPVPLDRSAPLDSWQLSRPNVYAVAGYAGQVSVPAGGTVGLHLRALEPAVRLDVFRVGANDATHLATVARVPVSWQPEGHPALPAGRAEVSWPVSYSLAVPQDWRGGFYLVKLTTIPGGLQSYVPFVVRATAPAPLVVVLPMLSYAAYNGWGGSDLYNWWQGARPRGAEASFDRPYEHGYGAGMLFRLDFPLLVWLEDSGYRPEYITDLDVINDPTLVTKSKVVVLSGHPEYWAQADRDAFDAAQAAGVSILGMGANMAYWQVRLRPNSAGVPDRTVVCWKSFADDPLAAADPQGATIRFQDPPVNRPPRDLLGEPYGGIVEGLAPMVLGQDIVAFAPDSGLKPGQELPGLIGDEVDDASTMPGALLLSQTPVKPRGLKPNVAGSSAWVTPSGAHVFDAGTFDWSWGLDPRYSAALPGFPAAGYAHLMADILAWAGAAPGS